MQQELLTLTTGCPLCPIMTHCSGVPTFPSPVTPRCELVMQKQVILKKVSLFGCMSQCLQFIQGEILDVPILKHYTVKMISKYFCSLIQTDFPLPPAPCCFLWGWHHFLLCRIVEHSGASFLPKGMLSSVISNYVKGMQQLWGPCFLHSSVGTTSSFSFVDLGPF